jgi:hypothetical protein
MLNASLVTAGTGPVISVSAPFVGFLGRFSYRALSSSRGIFTRAIVVSMVFPFLRGVLA